MLNLYSELTKQPFFKTMGRPRHLCTFHTKEHFSLFLQPACFFKQEHHAQFILRAHKAVLFDRETRSIAVLEVVKLLGQTLIEKFIEMLVIVFIVFNEYISR